MWLILEVWEYLTFNYTLVFNLVGEDKPLSEPMMVRPLMHIYIISLNELKSDLFLPCVSAMPQAISCSIRHQPELKHSSGTQWIAPILMAAAIETPTVDHQVDIAGMGMFMFHMNNAKAQ